MADPTTVTGLLRRWRADSITGVANGGAVAAWVDSVGSLSAAQTTTTAQPTFITAGANGQPCVRFDGTTDYLATTALPSRPVPYSVVIVAAPSRVDTLQALLTGANGLQITVSAGGRAQLLAGATQLSPAAVLAANAPHVFTALAVNSTTADAAQLAIDGANSGSNYATGTAVTSSGSGIWYFGRHDTAARFLQGDLYEVLLYDHALTDAEQATVHTYVQDRYGITVADYNGTTTPPVTPPTSTGRPFADLADWLWNPIKANPAIDPNSATMVTAIWQGGSRVTGASLHDYGVVIIDADQITSSTSPPRYDVPLAHETGGTSDLWGANPFGAGAYLPIASTTKLPPMHSVWDAAGENFGDAHYSVLDPIDNKIKSIWQLERLSSTSYQGSWGGQGDLHGDGREQGSGTSTAAGFVRPAGVVRIAELAAAAAANTGLNHALFMSIDQVNNTFRFPAVHTDGAAGDAVPMGTRFQLNPSINVDAIAGITAAEKVLAKTLQTHGAYVGDGSGGACNIIFEFDQGSTDGTANNPTTSPGATYKSLGLTSDYYALSKIPWASMRALASDESGTSTTTTAFTGSLALTGSGTLTRTGSPQVSSPLALSGSGALSLVGVPGAIGTLTRTGSGALTLDAPVVVVPGSGSLSLSGSGALSLLGTPRLTGTLARTGSGTLLVAAPGLGTLVLSAQGALTLSGEATVPPTWVFAPPSITVPFQIRGRLWGAYEQGVTVFRVDGAWFTASTPSADQLAVADPVYEGGRLHELGQAERDELRAAGFGGYLTPPAPDEGVYPSDALFPSDQLFPN